MKIVNRVLLLLLMLLCALGTAAAGDIEPGTPAKLNLVVHYDYDETDPERIRPLLPPGSSLPTTNPSYPTTVSTPTALKSINCDSALGRAQVNR